MSAIGGILAILGWIIMAVGGIWLLVIAFKEHILWGLGSLFIPFVGLVFVIMHWKKSAKPFFIWLAGFVVMFVGALLSGMGAAQG